MQKNHAKEDIMSLIKILKQTQELFEHLNLLFTIHAKLNVDMNKVYAAHTNLRQQLGLRNGFTNINLD